LIVRTGLARSEGGSDRVADCRNSGGHGVCLEGKSPPRGLCVKEIEHIVAPDVAPRRNGFGDDDKLAWQAACP
jgi:hypothetical protein